MQHVAFITRATPTPLPYLAELRQVLRQRVISAYGIYNEGASNKTTLSRQH